MTITYISNEEFEHHANMARKEATKNTVFITDHGSVTHVLLSFNDYLALQSTSGNIIDALGMPNSAEIDFLTPKITLYADRIDLS